MSKRKFFVFLILTLALFIILNFSFTKRFPLSEEQQKKDNLKIESQFSRFSLGLNKRTYSPQIPSLEKIFSENHKWTATLSAQRRRTIVSTGDVLLARSVNLNSFRKNDFKWLFENTAKILKESNISLINLETPLISNCPLTNEGMQFCGSSAHLAGLLSAGIDLVNLANNHTGNHGVNGLIETIQLLENENIQVVGISGPKFINIRGLRFAFPGYNDVGPSQPMIANAQNSKVMKEVSEVKSLSDILVVSFHWGEEYVAMPTERQKELAHLAIDSGADLVLGHHPHWIQPVEIYQNRVIVYSHGNFIFDQGWSEKTRIGIVCHFVFYEKTLIDIEILPIKINSSGQPSFMESNERNVILGELKEISKNLISTH